MVVRCATTLMGLGLALLPAAATAGPTVEIAAPAPSPSARVGAFYTEPGAIKGARGANVVFHAGDRAGHSYCNPAGPGTRIVGAKLLARRWHTQHITGRLRVLGEAGEAWARTNTDLTHGTTFNQWTSPLSAGCVALEWYQTGRSAGGAGWNPIFTAQLTHLRVEDLQGPRVSGARAPAGWIRGATATVSWTSDDNRLFRGATGATIAGRDVSRGDAPNGPVSAPLDASGLSDGRHEVTVWRRGGGWAPATQTVQLAVDRTPPGTPAPGPLAGWSRDPHLDVDATDDATSGFREIQVRTLGGGWERLTHPRNVFPDGARRLSLRAVDVAGNASAAVERVFRVDTTPPIARLSARSSGPGTAALDISGTADHTSGVAAWTVRIGGPDGEVVARSSDPSALERVEAPQGAHRFHLSVRDEAGNTAEATSAPVRIETSPPRVRITKVPGGWIDGFRVAGARDNRLGIELSRPGSLVGLGPVQVQVRQDAGWKVVARYNEPGAARLGPAGHLLTIDLDVPGIVSGPADVRVVAMDPVHPAFRGVTRSHTVLLDLDGVDYRALGVPERGVAGARLDPASGAHYWEVASLEGVRFLLWDLEPLAPPRLRVAGTRRTRLYRGRRIPLRRTVVGRPLRVSGRIVGPSGGGLGGVVVVLRDPRRRTMARATTGSEGWFSLGARATRGGIWSAEAIGRGRLVSRLALRVRPRVRLKVSRREVPAGGRVVLSGSVLPRRGSYAKVVQLQFRDGGRWRPFANVRVGRSGRFRHVYRFRRAGGYAVAIRAVMLRQASWPFTPGASRPVRVSVGR